MSAATLFALSHFSTFLLALSVVAAVFSYCWFVHITDGESERAYNAIWQSLWACRLACVASVLFWVGGEVWRAIEGGALL